MNKRLKTGGGKSFISWWNNPKNQEKVFASDKADAEDLKKMTEMEDRDTNKTPQSKTETTEKDNE